MFFFLSCLLSFLAFENNLLGFGCRLLAGLTSHVLFITESQVLLRTFLCNNIPFSKTMQNQT